jgi:hypothetical protein
MINFLIKLAAKFIKEPTNPQMSHEQEMGLFAELYQNPTFRKYLNVRENYLINKHTEDFIANRINNSYGLAGQLLEIRNLRDRARVSYGVIDKQKKVSLNPKK